MHAITNSMWKYETVKTLDLSDRFRYGASGGSRKTYRIFDDSENEYFVTVDYAITFDRGPETMLFRSDQNGTITDWSDLWTVFDDGVSNDICVKEYVEYLNTWYSDSSTRDQKAHDENSQ